MIETNTEQKPVVTEIIVNGKTYKIEHLHQALQSVTPNTVGSYVIKRLNDSQFENLVEDLLTEILEM